MHVRIAWEIYYHQNKQNSDKLGTNSGGPSGGILSSPSSSSSTSVGGVMGAGGQPGLGIKSSNALSIAPSHLLHRASDLPPPAYATGIPTRSPYETSPLAASFIGAPPSHIGKLNISSCVAFFVLHSS